MKLTIDLTEADIAKVAAALKRWTSDPNMRKTFMHLLPIAISMMQPKAEPRSVPFEDLFKGIRLTDDDGKPIQ